MAKSVGKIRADQLLLDMGLADSLVQAQARIMAGEVLANDLPVFKAGVMISRDAVLRLRGGSGGRFVSRAADKLASAHSAFGFDVAGKVALDVGISTGGFTDFLIQNGASTVFGVDVGYGQVSMKLQQNPNVVVLERMNARLLTQADFLDAVRKKTPSKLADAEAISLVVMDLSFISVLSVLPAIVPIVQPGSVMIVMIKPQFEASRTEIRAGGVVKDIAIRALILDRVISSITEMGFAVLNRADSAVAGPKGNLEHFVALRSPLA